ncbi:oxidoreductase family protein [Crucibulum laeve]|uniref:Oxidoreductase family protein n=1 Tax=Crucibulum laeve TaxID=68775 RepID=A0A5C3LFA8_9AGAR|nr:oxidoreductase family protein [Crucibulum laeve]
MTKGEKGIAILGAGIFAKEAHLPALLALTKSSTPPPALKAVYSRSQPSATDLAAFSKSLLGLATPPDVYYDVSSSNSDASNASESLDALLARDDISAVLVILPITLQPSIIIQALKAGKHVLSEKPVAASVAAALELISTYEKEYKPKGLVWRVAENFEAESGYQLVGEIVKAGKVGEVKTFKATVVNYIDKDSKWYKTPWRTVPDYQGGFLLDGGVHTIAALRTMLPGSFTHLSAFASLSKEYLKPHDTIHSVVRGGTGNSTYHGIIELTWAHPTPTRPQADGIIITGSQGYISVNTVYSSSGGPPVIRIKTTRLVKVDDKEKEEVDEEEVVSKGVEAELASFFKAVEGKAEDGLGEPREALKDVAFIQAGLESEGKEVDLEALVKG